METVYKTESYVINRFKVTPSEDRPVDGSEISSKQSRIAGELVKVNNESFPVAAGKPDAIPRRTAVSLIYGFKGIRDLAPGKGEIKITVDLLNLALAISHQNLSQSKISEIKQGIRVKDIRAETFSVTAHTDNVTARRLLESWSAYLKREYNFISIQSVLKKRLEKTALSRDENLKYTASKNHALDSKINSTTMEKVSYIFSQFIECGDEIGFAALEHGKFPELYHVSYIISNIFFRRISKLALMWSCENDIQVKFDMDFTPEDVFEKCRRSYYPITYSEYKFYKKHHFEHVTERNLLPAKTPFCLWCLGKP